MARPWYKRYPGDFIAGTALMTLEQKGAYSMLLDLIYVRGGPVPDSPQEIARQCGCSTRKWKQIRADLIGMGKIYELNGTLRNMRADRELPENEKEAEKLSENGRKGGEKTHEKPSKKDENNAEKKPSPQENNALGEKGLVDNSKHACADQIPDARDQIEDTSPPPCTVSETGANDRPLDGGDLPDGDFGKPKPEDDPFFIPEHLRRKPTLAEQSDPIVPGDKTPAELIVKAYLSARDEAFGKDYQAGYPAMIGAAAGDGATARKWLEAGATPELVREVTLAVVGQMRNTGKKLPPRTMSYLDNPIGEALKAESRPMALGGGGKGQDGGVHPDSQINQWRGRMKGFQQNKLWMDRYGPTPDQPGCECPADILKEFGYGAEAESQ